jgi:hypothetical protein
MKPDLVSSAAYEIQLTADCELLRLFYARLVVVQGAGFPSGGVRRSSWQSPSDL